MSRSPEEEGKVGFAGLTLLRAVAGVIMVAHGAHKVQTFDEWQQNVANLGVPFPEIASYLAVAGELGGGLGLIVGLLTPIAAFGVAFTMATAILTVHLGNGLFARNNGWEYPLLMLCTALFFMVRGAGPVSVDAALRRAMHESRGRRVHRHAH